MARTKRVVQPAAPVTPTPPSRIPPSRKAKERSALYDDGGCGSDSREEYQVNNQGEYEESEEFETDGTEEMKEEGIEEEKVKEEPLEDDYDETDADLEYKPQATGSSFQDLKADNNLHSKKDKYKAEDDAKGYEGADEKAPKHKKILTKRAPSLLHEPTATDANNRPASEVIGQFQAHLFHELDPEFRGFHITFQFLPPFATFRVWSEIISDLFGAHEYSRIHGPLLGGEPVTPLDISEVFLLAGNDFAACMPDIQGMLCSDWTTSKCPRIYYSPHQWTHQLQGEYETATPSVRLRMGGPYIRLRWSNSDPVLPILTALCEPGIEQPEFILKVTTEEWSIAEKLGGGPLLLLFTPSVLLIATLKDVVECARGKPTIGSILGTQNKGTHIEVKWQPALGSTANANWIANRVLPLNHQNLQQIVFERFKGLYDEVAGAGTKYGLTLVGSGDLTQRLFTSIGHVPSDRPHWPFAT